jgi:hypothetical protein
MMVVHHSGGGGHKVQVVLTLQTLLCKTSRTAQRAGHIRMIKSNIKLVNHIEGGGHKVQLVTRAPNALAASDQEGTQGACPAPCMHKHQEHTVAQSHRQGLPSVACKVQESSTVTRPHPTRPKHEIAT